MTALLIALSLGLLNGDAAFTGKVYNRTGVGETEKHAAAEFARYAEKLTGIEFSVGEENFPGSRGDLIVLLDVNGNNPAALLAAGPRLRLPQHPDAFLIRGLQRDGPDLLVISGRTPRALIYGVYHYFEKVCHVGFFKDGEYVPELESLPVRGVDIVERPVFDTRQLGTKTTWHLFHEYTLEKNDFLVDWFAKRKANIGNQNNRRSKLYGLQSLFAGQPARVGVYMPPFYDAVMQNCPKALFSDGYSNWRGPKYYTNAGVYVENPDEAVSLSRILYRDFLASPPPKNAHHYPIYWSSEQDEWQHMAVTMLSRQCELNLERDPEAKFVLESYSAHGVTDFFRTNYPIVSYDNTNDNWSLPPGYRVPGDVPRQQYFSGHSWLHIASLSGSDNHFNLIPGFRDMIRFARMMTTQPEYANCDGFGLHVDAMSCWLFEDLYAELAWNPERVTYDSWLDSLALRRFGKHSQERMAESLRSFVDTGDRSWMYGYNRYRFHYSSAWDFSEQYWYKNVARDWFTQVDGGLDVDGFRQALELALTEAERQKGNALYDLYLIDVYRFLAHQSFKYVLIQLHSNYYRATKAFQAGRPDDAKPLVAAFENCARRLDLVLESLASVLSSRDEFVMMSGNGSTYWSRDKKHSHWRHFQNAQLDVFEIIKFVFRPSVALMVEEERKRLKAEETEFIEHRTREPWFPGPEPYFFYLAGADEETRKKEVAVIERFIEEPIAAPRFQGTTAEACREALQLLDRAECLSFPDMRSQDAIAANYPLSDESYRAASWQPVQLVRGKKGPWRGEEHYVVQPLYYAAQTPYSGLSSGRAIWLEDPKVELEFNYQYPECETANPPSSLTFSLLLDDLPAVSWTFFNDGNEVPDVATGKTSLSTIQRELGQGADEIEISRPAAGTQARPSETSVHKLRAVFEDGKVTAYLDDRVQLEHEISGEFRYASLQIDSYYTSKGAWPVLWIKDIVLNGEEVKLYTPDWFLAPAPTR